jgi:hypothetical protein
MTQDRFWSWDGLSDFVNHIRALLPWTRISVLVAAAACLLGAAQSAGVLASQIKQAGIPEMQRREQSWSWSYAFAMACEPHLANDARVALVNPVLGPGEPEPQALEFDPDASHFAYLLAPRVVSVQWNLASPWLPQPGETDYVALWDQAVDRTAAQRAAAASERELFDARFGSNVVCTYQDERGDVGTIYAVSPLAVGAAIVNADTTAEQAMARPYATLAGTVRAYLAVLSVWLVGLLVVGAIVRRGLGKALAVAIALPIGCLVVAVDLVMLSALRVPWSMPAVAALPIALLALFVLRQRDALARLRRGLVRRSTWRPPSISVSDALPVALLAGFVLVLLALAPLGLPAMDGFSAGYFKARFFLSNASVLRLYANAASLHYGQPTHPPLVALVIDWLYLVTGAIDEHATLILWPALVACALGTMYALLRSITSFRVSIWLTVVFVLSASDLVSNASNFGFADLPVAVFLLAGAGLLWLWAARDDRSWLVPSVGAILLAGAAWTKEEGIVAGPVALLALAVVARVQGKGSEVRWWMTPALATATYLLCLLPLLVLRVVYPAPELLVHAGSIANVAARLPEVLVGLVLRSIQHWYPAAALLVLALWHMSYSNVRARSWRALGILLAVIAIQVFADAGAITATPFEVGKELQWAAGRLLAQLTPLVYLAACVTFIMSAAVRDPRRAPVRTRAAAEAPSAPGHIRIEPRPLT